MSAQLQAATVPGAGDDAGGEREWRHAVRMRACERRTHAQRFPRRVVHWAWLLVAAFHVVLVLVVRHAALQRPPPLPEAVIEVELFDVPAPAPPLPQPQPRPLPKPHTVAPPGVPARSNVAETPRAPTPVAPTPPPSRPAHLFHDDGSAAVPDDLVEQIDRENAPNGFIALRVEPSPLLQPKRPLKVRPNHFAQYWTGADERRLDEKFWDAVTVTGQFTAPWGGRWACAWVLIVVACGDVPQKAWNPPQAWKPATELDER